MARRGENIYKRKDARWEGRYIKSHDLTGKPQFGYIYAKTYREAKEKLATAKQNVPTQTPTSKNTMDRYCDEWLLLCRNRVKASTYVKYHNTVTRHIKPQLGTMLPWNLNTVTVEAFSNRLLSDGLSAKTVRDILTVLRSILKHCHRQLGNSCPEIEIIYPKEQKKQMRVLTAEEQNVFIEYLHQDMDPPKFGVLLALLTGMRIGEICALRWEDISLQDRFIQVSSTMQRLQILDAADDVKTRICLGEAKSETSIRTIPLTAYAVSLCKKMQCADQTAYVLTGDPYCYLEPRALQYRLKKYTAACNIADVHFHTLRHTFATRCVEVGFEIKSLSEILGHASTRITLDRYVHSSLELKRENMDKLAAVGF